MKTDFQFIGSDVTVAEAEEHMDAAGVDAIAVLNPDRTVFGLLTQKNLAHFHRRPLNNPRAFHAWEICDARPVATSAITPVEDVVTRMLETNCPHVMVVDENRHLVGVISTDILLERNISGARDASLRSNDRPRSAS